MTWFQQSPWRRTLDRGYRANMRRKFLWRWVSLHDTSQANDKFKINLIARRWIRSVLQSSIVCEDIPESQSSGQVLQMSNTRCHADTRSIYVAYCLCRKPGILFTALHQSRVCAVTMFVRLLLTQIPRSFPTCIATSTLFLIPYILLSYRFQWLSYCYRCVVRAGLSLLVVGYLQSGG